MGNFCNNCGKALQEGEVCNCTQQQNNQASGYCQQQPQQNYVQKKGIPKLLVPIVQTVVGGILILFGLMTDGYDWAYISYVAAVGFLTTGICGIIEAKK